MNCSFCCSCCRSWLYTKFWVCFLSFNSLLSLFLPFKCHECHVFTLIWSPSHWSETLLPIFSLYFHDTVEKVFWMGAWMVTQNNLVKIISCIAAFVAAEADCTLTWIMSTRDHKLYFLSSISISRESSLPMGVLFGMY